MSQVIPSPPPFRSSSRRRQITKIRNPRSFRTDPRRSRCHDVRRHTPSPNTACFASIPRSNTPTTPSSVAVHSTASASVNPDVDLTKQPNKTALGPGWTPIRISSQNSPCPSPRLSREARRRPRYNRRQEQEELQRKAQEEALSKEGQDSRAPRPQKPNDRQQEPPPRQGKEEHQKRAQELALGREGQENVALKCPRAQQKRDRQQRPQPRRPEESAPPSSHPASLAELSLPFRTGSTITDPVSRAHYTLVELIGRGAYALVWRARRSTDSALVALKCLSTKSLTPAQRVLQLLEVELHARSYKQAPASVVPFYGAWKHPCAPWLWLCMGNCPSGDLYTWLTEGAGSSPSLLRPNCPLRRKYWLEILTAVREIHSVGVSHRDLKPENFLISAKNSVLLGDFGLATVDTSSDDWECGSRPYMSPEVRNYPQLDVNSSDPVPPNGTPYVPHLADTWSLGIVYLNLHYRSPAWSTPDETCPAYSSFRRDPDTWLRDVKGVETAEERDWLIRRVFVPESERCTVAEWLEWEKRREPYAQRNTTGYRRNVNTSLKHGGAVQECSSDVVSTATVPKIGVVTNKTTDTKINGIESHRSPAPHSAPASTTSVTSLHLPCHLRKTSWADDEVWNSVMDFSTPLVFDEPVGKRTGKKSSSCIGMEKDDKTMGGKNETIDEATEVCHKDEENPFEITAGNDHNSVNGSKPTWITSSSAAPSSSQPTPSTNLTHSFQLLRASSSSSSITSSPSSSSLSSSMSH